MRFSNLEGLFRTNERDFYQFSFSVGEATLPRNLPAGNWKGLVSLSIVADPKQLWKALWDKH
jgi:hypothetical protein